MIDLDKLAWSTKWEPLSGKQFQNAQSLSGANVWKNAPSKGLSGAQKANIWSAGLNFASKFLDKSSKGTPGVRHDPSVGNQLQAGSHDWMKFFQSKFIA